MLDNYSQDNEYRFDKLKPKLETIKFIIQYSKSMQFLKTNNYRFEINMN